MKNFSPFPLSWLKMFRTLRGCIRPLTSIQEQSALSGVIAPSKSNRFETIMFLADVGQNFPFVWKPSEFPYTETFTKGSSGSGQQDPPFQPFSPETKPIITIIKKPCRQFPYTPQGMNSPLRIRRSVQKYKTGGNL